MTKRGRHTLAATAAIGALLALDHWAFPLLFGVGYVEWYVRNGAAIGFLSALFGAAWGNLDRNAGLISAHPLDYVGAACQLVGLPMIALGESIGAAGSAGGAARLDRLLAALIGLALSIGLLAWLVTVAPLQYLAFLVFGAPARAARRAPTRPLARLDGTRVEVRRAAHDEKPPEGWWDAGLGQKPFAFTSLVQGFAFFVWKLVAG